MAMPRKHILIFLGMYSVMMCQSQHLDKESLDELARRESELHEKRYPHCMRDTDEVTLWCDDSRYEGIEDITMQNDSDGETIIGIASELQVLYVNNSRLQFLNSGDLTIFVQLTTFVVENNFLTELAQNTFLNNPTLEVIDLSRNKIGQIASGAFTGLKTLFVLELDFNRIGSLTRRMFQDLNNLEYLSLAGNQIQVIQTRLFSVLGNLKTLILKDNKISKIDRYGLSGLNALEVLDLSHNKIAAILPKTFQPLRKLRKLYLRGNQLKFYPSDLQVYTLAIEVLDIGENHMTSFSNETFSPLAQLRILKIDQNSLTNIDESMFLGNADLEILNISANALEEIPANTFATNRNLTTLLLQANNLKTPRIEWFENSQTILEGKGELNLDGNEWWCDCTTKAYEAYMLQARGKSPAFAEQLDIRCSSNKAFVGKLSKLDIFCPSDGSNRPRTLTSTTRTQKVTTTSGTPGKLLGLPPTEIRSTANTNILSSTTTTTTTTTTPRKVSTSTTPTGPRESNRSQYAATNTNTTLIFIVILVLIAAIVIAIVIVKQMKSKKNCFRKMCLRASRRKRHLSSTPFLEENSHYGVDMKLTEPFSDDENQNTNKFGRNDAATLPHDEDTYYTPTTTPRMLTRAEHGGA